MHRIVQCNSFSNQILLRDKLDQTSLRKLAKILETKASTKTSFYQVITENFGQKLCQKKAIIISQAAEL